MKAMHRSDKRNMQAQMAQLTQLSSVLSAVRIAWLIAVNRFMRVVAPPGTSAAVPRRPADSALVDKAARDDVEAARRTAWKARPHIARCCRGVWWERLHRPL